MTEPPVVYREVQPPPELAPFVRCIWRLRGVTDGAAEPIIPDGCVEIVVNAGDPFVRHTSPTASHVQSQRLVAGQLTRAITLEATGRIDIWGVRLHPWCASSFTEIPASDIRDRDVALGDIARPLDRALAHVGDAPSEEDAEQTLIAALLRQATRATLPGANVSRLVSFAATRSETSNIRALSRDAGVSTRRLQMIFREHVGLSPKQLLRVTRFQRALRLARAEPRLSWGGVAHAAGFYDHAHLIHDSNEIAGCTPAELVSRDANLTAAFLSDDAAGMAPVEG
jgi:AraC-like DNA-binding protein